ncbi:zinc finger protein 496-like [Thalassophryne amazonica]|uniref:zinc finger protein 496-like n=1 Tax=Thalassophryne amazonica TaxID=390379 RepID=UPI001470BF17|nr:zinc finger protein 496-like [Thalassophryne amazonica]
MEPDGMGCRIPEPVGNSNRFSHLAGDIGDKSLDSSDPESDNSDFWTETRKRPLLLKAMKHNEFPVRGPQAGPNTRRSNVVPVSDMDYEPEKNSLTCNECGTCFTCEHSLMRHRLCPRERNKSWWCSLCAAQFPSEKSLERHMAVLHAKRITCPMCDKIFTRYKNLKQHDCVTPFHQRQTEDIKEEDCGGSEPGSYHLCFMLYIIKTSPETCGCSSVGERDQLLHL